MGETKIEWAHYTFNPWMGCTKVSPACANCYAAVETPVRVLRGQGVELWGDQGERRRTSEANWREPLKWNKEAKKAGERRRVFCASLADVFEDHASIQHAWRGALFALIQQTPHLDWLLLTKRPENVLRLWPAIAPDYYPNGWRNIWIGTTVENQEQADKRIPELLKIPARVRFLSCEPLLGPVHIPKAARWHFSDCACLDCCDLRARGEEQAGIDWVIVGGESGPNARPMHPDWARDLRDQCEAAGVPFFFKQWGEWAPFATQAGYRANSTWPGNAEIIGGDCGGPSTLSNCGDGFWLAEWPDGTKKRVRYLNRADHKWGKENLLEMQYVSAGKQLAGRLLDGVEYSQFPEVA